jgi:hypothetical protein
VHRLSALPKMTRKYQLGFLFYLREIPCYNGICLILIMDFGTEADTFSSIDLKVLQRSSFRLISSDFN